MARLNTASGLENPLQKIFPQPITATRAPTTSDRKYAVGQVWIRTDTNQAWTLTSVASNSATWALSSPGASDVDTLTGDSGGALSPAAGNITLAGGTNITTAGAASTITFNLDAAISLATSVTSPIYTASAADLNINSATGQDVIIKMGDNAAANKVSFTDSDDVEVFAIDSNGGIGTLSGLTVSGAAISLNASSNFNTVINSGTSTGSVTIGNGAAGAITIDSGAGISLDAATASNFSTSGAGADLTLASAAGRVIVDAGEDAADAIYLHANAGTSETIRLHADQGTGAASVHLESDAGGITLTSTGLATSDAINLNAVAGGIDMDAALDIVLTSTENAADSIYLHANGGVSEQIRLHSDQGTGVASVHLESDVGGITLTATGLATSDAINLSAAAGGIDMDAALDIVLTSTEDAADSIYLHANGGTSETIRLHSDQGTGAASVHLESDVGGVTLTSGLASADAINIAAASGGLDIDTGLAIIADAAGNVEINSSAGTILIGNDDVDQNISLGTDGEREVTVGSTNGAAGLTLQAGTGNITATGTFENIDAKYVVPTGVNYTFRSSPSTSTAANTGGVATGAGGAINILSFPQFNMEQFMIGTQTIIKPVMDASGLLCSLDLTNTDGVEYNFGAARTLSEYAFTIGTSAAFFFEATLTVADISGGNPYIIGFRKAEANNATYSNYTDYYALGMISGTSPTNVTLTSELNGGGQTLQDSTDAWTGGDGGTTTLKVLVSAAGVVTAQIDGGAPSAPLAYTFDNTDVVCPFIHLVHNADAGAVHLVDLQVGFQ